MSWLEFYFCPFYLWNRNSADVRSQGSGAVLPAEPDLGFQATKGDFFVLSAPPTALRTALSRFAFVGLVPSGGRPACSRAILVRADGATGSHSASSSVELPFCSVTSRSFGNFMDSVTSWASVSHSGELPPGRLRFLRRPPQALGQSHPPA